MYGASFGWARDLPMSKKGETHETLSLLFKLDVARGNFTSNYLDRLLAHNNRDSFMDVPLSSEVQVYKIIVISSSYDRSAQDRSYTISRGNNPTSPFLTLAHANS